MDYLGHTVRLGSLAGKIYEQLYCPNALSLPVETRRARVEKLSQELHGLIEASRATGVSSLEEENNHILAHTFG